MPNNNGQGPRGEGPRTGRGMGRCSVGENYGQGGRANRGRGFGSQFFQGLKGDDKKKALQEEALSLKDDLENIEKELANLDS